MLLLKQLKVPVSKDETAALRKKITKELHIKDSELLHV